MPTPEQMRPEQMRTAVARYVEEIHRAYVAQASPGSPPDPEPAS